MALYIQREKGRKSAAIDFLHLITGPQVAQLLSIERVALIYFESVWLKRCPLPGRHYIQMLKEWQKAYQLNAIVMALTVKIFNCLCLTPVLEAERVMDKTRPPSITLDRTQLILDERQSFLNFLAKEVIALAFDQIIRPPATYAAGIRHQFIATYADVCKAAELQEKTSMGMMEIVNAYFPPEPPRNAFFVPAPALSPRERLQSCCAKLEDVFKDRAVGKFSDAYRFLFTALLTAHLASHSFLTVQQKIDAFDWIYLMNSEDRETLYHSWLMLMFTGEKYAGTFDIDTFRVNYAERSFS